MKRENYLVALLFVFIITNFIFAFIHLKPTFTGGVIIEGLDSEEEDVEESVDVARDVKELEVIESEVEEVVLETGFVGKIIDGDTVIINGDSVRLLGIDADERGYECYGEAKKRLEELVLDKNILLERDGEDKDQYDRYLRYLILDDENINLKLVEEGLAIARFGPDNKKYRNEILEAEQNSRANQIGCKWSEFDGGEFDGNNLEDASPLGSSEEIELEEGIVFVCNAGNYMESEQIVEGKVVGVYRSESDTVFLNFERAYPMQCFTAVIFKSYLNEFDNYESYEGKRMRISGKIEEYNGKPEIILKDIGQIEIV